MPRTDQRTSRHSWLLASVPVIMLAMFLIPYTLLAGVDAWYGSALFWTVATVAVIAVNVLVSSTWSDEGEDDDAEGRVR